MELYDAIMTRRSIRRYKPDPVDDKKIETILEAGRWAPSWANSQCWRFIVVKDAGVRAKLADTLLKVVRGDQEVDNAGVAALKVAPLAIVVCAKIGQAGLKPGATGTSEYVTDKGDWFMFDTALAVQNMVLAAHDQGLGTVIIGAFDAVRAQQVLGLPSDFRAVALFPVGVPDMEGKAPPRKELSELTRTDRWSS